MRTPPTDLPKLEQVRWAVQNSTEDELVEILDTMRQEILSLIEENRNLTRLLEDCI